MKLKYLIFIVLFFTSSVKAVTILSDEIHLLGSFFEGKQVNYIVKKNDIANVPDWSGEGKPPLSNNNAIRLALKKHNSKFGEVAAKITKIKISSKKTNCSSVQKCPTTVWFYKIKIQGETKATYIILMDGRFIDPRYNNT